MDASDAKGVFKADKNEKWPSKIKKIHQISIAIGNEKFAKLRCSMVPGVRTNLTDHFWDRKPLPISTRYTAFIHIWAGK